MKDKKKPRWFVEYLLFGNKRRIRRLFPTESKARAFYYKLCRRRRNPPEQMSIQELPA